MESKFTGFQLVALVTSFGLYALRIILNDLPAFMQFILPSCLLSFIFPLVWSYYFFKHKRVCKEPNVF